MVATTKKQVIVDAEIADLADFVSALNTAVM